jgi:thiamine pyrophosphokinase
MEKHAEKILIVSGGTLDDAFVLWLMRREKFDRVFACDKGMEFFYRNHWEPDLILGDFDSADPAVLEYFRSRPVELQQFPAEKDWTDTELAIRLALEQKPKEIYLLGATGSRLDHVLGNIGLLEPGLEAGVQIFLLDPCNRIRLIDRELYLKKAEQFGAYISLFPWEGPVHGLTLEGMKYPLANVTLAPGCSLGLSNEISESEARIFFTEGKLLVFETNDEREESFWKK